VSAEHVELDRIVLALDNALGEAQTFAQGSHDDFHELVRHCREMYDILLAVLVRHPELATTEMRSYVDATRATIHELELLAGTPTARH